MPEHRPEHQEDDTLSTIQIDLFATLDLVGQAPGSPEEDPDGFPFGGLAGTPVRRGGRRARHSRDAGYGRPAPGPQDLRHLRRVLAEPGRRRRRRDRHVLQQHPEVRRPRWLPTVAGSLIDWVWLESRAREIRSFETAVLPGLLQTREYAEALIRAAHAGATKEQITRFVDLRMARQRRLEEPEPAKFSTIIEEGALRRLVGGPETMKAQLAHLRAVAGWPNVEIMILPAATGAHASPNGPFDVFRMRRPYPFTGCISTAAGTLVVEGEKAERLVAAYDRLRCSALENGAVQRFLFDLSARLE